MKNPLGRILLPLVFLSLAGLVSGSDSSTREPKAESLPDQEEPSTAEQERKPGRTRTRPGFLEKLEGWAKDHGVTGTEPRRPAEIDNSQVGKEVTGTPYGGGLDGTPSSLVTTGPQAEQLTNSWDVYELLPKDTAGGVDWVRALREKRVI